MKRKWRRYELLLPRRLNDGRAVPNAWLEEAVDEILHHFGAARFERQKVEGRWIFNKKLYRDVLTCLVVDVIDTEQHRRWMRRFRSKWETRLQQIEIWMVSYRIEVE